MRWLPDHSCSVAVYRSETDVNCYRWAIHSPDGRCLARSPYAFATKAAARLSGKCWKEAIISGSSTT
jgi:hypothetical protein